jgi:hypothetical protein
MKKNEAKIRAMQMSYIAQAQSIARKILVMGQGPQPSHELNRAFRQINGVPVFHCGFNMPDFEIDSDARNKRRPWGNFHHPYMMIGMPEVGGDNKVYVDSSVPGKYLLWIYSKLDEWGNGPGYWAEGLIAWTPRIKGDTLIGAGYRLFWAAVMAMDGVVEEGFYSHDADEEGNWVDSWTCSDRCFQVLAAVRNTRYDSEKDFEKTLRNAPEMLQPHIRAMALE